MMDLFRNVNFVCLFIATMASQLGTMVGNMAFTFYLLNRFSSQPFYASTAELMYTLPTLFVFLIVGVAADRFKPQAHCGIFGLDQGGTDSCTNALYRPGLGRIFLLNFISPQCSR
jgi:MFS family permease